MTVKEEISTKKEGYPRCKGTEMTLLVFDLFGEHYAIEVSKIRK